jgi:hypothetical protein
MQKQGSWWLKSETDPRFDASGRGIVGGFQCPEEAKAAIKQKEEELGVEAPEDLEFGYMKD